MKRGSVQLLVVVAIALAASLVASASALAATIEPYDGDNPFRCKTQRVGTGVDFRDPDADPFCVEFDKTQQNVTDFGIVEFLLLEPARVAAAVPKCFYHQTDHWTGSIVQGSSPELWHWDGRYFFDKARGMGGVRVDNFRIGEQTADPRTLPGFPPQYMPYFGPGGGGVMAEIGPADPSCVAKVDTPAEQGRVYKNAWR
jgi:hypothetical protein